MSVSLDAEKSPVNGPLAPFCCGQPQSEDGEEEKPGRQRAGEQPRDTVPHSDLPLETDQVRDERHITGVFRRQLLLGRDMCCSPAVRWRSVLGLVRHVFHTPALTLTCRSGMGEM